MRMGLTTIEYERERERERERCCSRWDREAFQSPIWVAKSWLHHHVHYLRGKRVTKKLVTTDGNTRR